MGDPSDTTVKDRLKLRIEALWTQQSEALQTALYVGMTETEAQEYDQRRHQITVLVAELTGLQKIQ